MEQQNWFYRLNDQQVGPVARDQVIHLITQQILTAESYVWAEGMENWQRIESITDFAAFIPAGQSKQRPTSVTVLGILNIVFGGLFLTCLPLIFVTSFIPQPEGSPIILTPQMEIFSNIGIGVRFVFSLISLISGIGLLNLKRWARQTAYIYGWLAICWKITALIVSSILYHSTLNQLSPEMLPIIAIGGMCGELVGFIYPIILIVFMRKPHVIKACNK